MAGESNGNKKGRLDRIEEALERIAEQCVECRRELEQLLKAQALLVETTKKLPKLGSG